MTERLSVWILIVLFLAIVFFLLRMSRRLAKRQRRMLTRLEDDRDERKYHDINEYHQQTLFYQLHAFLAPSFPLPPMRGWAISPDFALLMIGLLEDCRPARIVEFGSGASTLIGAYCLRRIGAGKIISVDHDPLFAQRTRADLQRHGLSHWADVRVAELQPSTYRDDVGQSIEWYDIDVVGELPNDIDLVIIDGPPTQGKSLARYPALPELGGRLAPGAIVLLDDADRVEEKAVLERWQREFPAAHFGHEETEKGTAIVTL